ncbi:MAG: hypothetical protein LC745_07005 [Planctomycetia bacterium]|nr:hypothetical protein [Planctomycetia bacterium]
MKKSRQFRPMVDEAPLEERVVLSVTASALPAAHLLASVNKPVVTSADVNTTLNQLHNALLSYESNVTNSIRYAESQIAAGHVTKAASIRLLESYIGNKTSQLFFQTRSAAGRLPFGAGFNGFVNATKSGVGDLPSGTDSLYAQLTFPSNGTNGPVAVLQNNVFNPVSTGDFNSALRAVNTTAIHTTFAQVKAIVNQYVVNGVRAHDFTYRR